MTPNEHVVVTKRTLRRYAAEIEAAAETVRADAIDQPREFIRECQLAAALLPAAVRGELLDFVSDGAGALLLTDLKIGPLPPTPDTTTGRATAATLLARETAIIASALGTPIGYRSDGDGELLQPIVPTRQRYRTKCEDAIDGGVDRGYTSTRPAYVVAGCFRGDPRAETLLLSARELVHHLPIDTVMQLWEPHYYTTVEVPIESLLRTRNLRGRLVDRGPIPVLSGSWEDPVVSYSRGMFGKTDEAAQALQAVRQVWAERRHSFVLTPGSILVADNSRLIRGRTSYAPQRDGGDRWLVRVRVVTDLASSRFARRHGSHVVELEGC